ncbi:MAG TPA: IclR family transcriptional regulator [Acidimicrobiales bacterium]|nr:IclR family transcriptional regulator [Acidimicrobiales bacterium]
MSEGGLVRSAERALDVLLYLAGRARPVPAMTIARECGLPRSSTYHLLKAMARRDFVTHFPVDKTWGLGVAAFEIGSAYLRSDPLERLARPIVTRLAADMGETVHLAVLHGAEVVYLDKRQPTRNRLPLVSEVGVRLPAHLTAVGKAMLMMLDDAQVRALYPAGLPMVNRTGRGPRSRQDLLRELAAQRGAGCAVEESQTTTGIACIAAPVLDRTGRPQAAIGVSFVSGEHGPRQRARITATTQAAARELSAVLGWRHGPSGPSGPTPVLAS